MRFISPSFVASLLLAANVAGAQSNLMLRQPVNLTGWPCVVLYADTNHTVCAYPKGMDDTNATIRTYPNSTTAGMNEIQELFPWTTNGISSGFCLLLAGGVYYYSTPIGITNNCVIKGAGWFNSVFRYTGPTNDYSVVNITNNPYGSSLFRICRNPFTNALNDMSVPNVIIENVGFTSASNFPANLVYVDAERATFENCMFGGPTMLISGIGGFHVVQAEVEMQTTPSGLVGTWVECCYNNCIFKDCVYGCLADGIWCPGGSWDSVEDCDFYICGNYNGTWGTMYPQGSVLALGFGVGFGIAPQHASIRRGVPYKCNAQYYIGAVYGDASILEMRGESCNYAVLADPAAVANVSLGNPGRNLITPVIIGATGYLIDSNHVHDVPEVYTMSSGYGGGDPDGGSYGWSISEHNTRIFGFENSGGFDNFNDFFINQNYPLFANGSGLNNIPASAIVGGVLQTNSAAVAQTNFISGLFYTNNTTSMQMVFATIQLKAPGGLAVSEMDLIVTNPGTAFTVKAPALLDPVASSPGSTTTKQLTLPVPSGTRYYFTNLGNATIIPGTGILKIN